MKHTLYPHKPLLKSYISNTYEKMFPERQLRNNYEKYFLNQEVACWDMTYAPEDFANKERFLAFMNRPLTIEQYRSLFLKHISVEWFQENKEILDKIYEDAKKIHQALSKLDNLGIQYTLDITGGAVRDFILGKPIKDIDIMLSIETNHVEPNETLVKSIMNISHLKKYFTKEEIFYLIENCPEEEILINGEAINEMNSKKQQLILLCLQDLVHEKFFNTKQLDSEDNYLDVLSSKDIIGIFKLDQEKMELNFPVDILLTGLQKEEFVDRFDLDLCKVSFSLKNSHYQTQFPQDALELISRFTSPLCFWQDVNNKVMTINIDCMNDDLIKNAIGKHYKRLLIKYPEYGLKLYSNNTKEEKKEEIQERINKLQYYYLEEILESKNAIPQMKI